MNIGEAASASGVSAKMIRHYEETGLIPRAGRTDAGYRVYGERDVHLLRFIRQARQLGFSMAQVSDLIGLWLDQSRSSRKVKQLAQTHIGELDQRIRELQTMKATLERLAQDCHGDSRPDCPILDALGGQGDCCARQGTPA
ncbi:Cu(I)-responsive transcriptional regulator [Herbaspirillum sp. BH-1]|uniref:Transcription regulator protein n=2 Tax=Herbaspirillum frisingense TaxID=92645 RepID=A0AAI9N1I8_9BURK|nr:MULTISPECIES: Cu(I)-responsive transcriptional regulator [Herbaspirillum]EOA02363.1 transcription regulator protein [Herbaspirillum frisingense GSF30]MDR6586559.1 Cu(I)-responsive transcriptional regulator [Herbaspirillum frisingense]PLY61526.1 Cu(I)-responsive transcriptional regulator [Herbaspirillum sp. BH-1]UIN23013.1 Cu(I)-responsive transcriptional regulator [Herbaspirillum frisingense]